MTDYPDGRPETSSLSCPSFINLPWRVPTPYSRTSLLSSGSEHSGDYNSPCFSELVHRFFQDDESSAAVFPDNESDRTNNNKTSVPDSTPRNQTFLKRKSTPPA
ncbi:hypothetical protein ACFX1Q_010260 [Malus domestica]